VSSVEIFNFLKKNLGIIIKRLEETGVISLPSYLDHNFMPEIEVGDTQVELPLRGMLYKVKVVNDVPVYLNIDRPITDREYSVVYPGSYRIIPRAGYTLYLKAPQGYRSRVMLETLGC